MWTVGAEAAKHFANVVDTIASVCLVMFGLWTAASAWQEAGHVHREPEKQSGSSGDKRRRITLLLILGSSPMVEGIQLAKGRVFVSQVLRFEDLGFELCCRRLL